MKKKSHPTRSTGVNVIGAGFARIHTLCRLRLRAQVIEAGRNMGENLRRTGDYPGFDLEGVHDKATQALRS